MEKCHISTGEPRTVYSTYNQLQWFQGADLKRKKSSTMIEHFSFTSFFRSSGDQSFNKYVVVMIFSSGSNTVFFPFLSTWVPQLLLLLCIPTTIVLLQVPRGLQVKPV